MTTPTQDKVWTVLDVLKWAEGFLKSKGLPNPRGEAELLLMAVLGVERVQIYVQFERVLTLAERDKYKEFLLRRAKHEPVQYITGFAYFLGLRFAVNPKVLIPRFDTEILAEAVIKFVRAQPGTEFTIIDIGTGSGCLAVSLAKLLKMPVYALDISSDALAIAKQNAETNKVADRIKFLESDILSNLIHEEFSGKVLIVSNPPYVTPYEYAELSSEVRDHEPYSALYAEADGLGYYRKIVSQAAFLGDHLAGIFFEVGHKQAAAASLILAKYHQQVFTLKDLGGKERVVYTLIQG